METTDSASSISFTPPGTGGTVHVLGIRHHGPGSAQRVKAYLEQTRPDLVLVEGPPEADSLLPWAAHAGLEPPVALLCYQPDELSRSVFYPFAAFSPEWQAIRYAVRQKVPVRFFDLPVAQQMALDKQKEEEQGAAEPKAAPGETPLPDAAPLTEAEAVIPSGPGPYDIRKDPVSYLAEAAGYEDGEKWWEQTFEHRQSNEEVFQAVAEAMQHLRAGLHLPENRLEQLREAHMRRMIRQAGRELYQNIVVVCGAWHVPALLQMPSQKEDNDLLKGLPRGKVECTWVPWTHNRLSYFSGYGAGIHSPGWYSHVWQHPADDGTRWMSRVAELLRNQGMDTSTAHVIEAVRLAQALAALRGLPKSGLDEMNEAALSVLCNGEDGKLVLISEQLIVGNELGVVPADIPRPPLQVDIEKAQKALRLPAAADFKDYTLDLRKELDLQRSIFLHRLRLLGLGWGQEHAVSGKGTFKEQWRLQWDPAFSIDIIERGAWGNTVEVAANKFVVHGADEASSLQQVTELLQQALPADLHDAVDALIGRINNLAAASGDVLQLAAAIPPLAAVSRYGNVRKTDAGLVLGIVESMITRICVGLPNAVSGLGEEAAQEVLELIRKLNDAVSLLQQPDTLARWQAVLHEVAGSPYSAPAVAGYATRLLRDFGRMQGEELVRVFGFRMSRTNAPAWSAAWLEGFLKGSGTLLLLDEDLWSVLNGWVSTLEDADFTEVLPLLRRTFAQFTPPERHKLGEKARHGSGSVTRKTGGEP
ncbi:MAG TPA: DUF5682 family protein, partial [Chitinophagaceae bacterium]|nr:DUF5682 family protein [Chitinophagaceae bacterium]